MGIWIRKQDRASLVLVDFLEITLSQEIVGYNIVGNGFYRLGTYDEREQCIRITDEIAEAIERGRKVYEMPLYEDVK